jgi:hypothetical protein
MNQPPAPRGLRRLSGTICNNLPFFSIFDQNVGNCQYFGKWPSLLLVLVLVEKLRLNPENTERLAAPTLVQQCLWYDVMTSSLACCIVTWFMTDRNNMNDVQKLGLWANLAGLLIVTSWSWVDKVQFWCDRQHTLISHLLDMLDGSTTDSTHWYHIC